MITMYEKFVNWMFNTGHAKTIWYILLAITVLSIWGGKFFMDADSDSPVGCIVFLISIVAGLLCFMTFFGVVFRG